MIKTKKTDVGTVWTLPEDTKIKALPQPATLKEAIARELATLDRDFVTLNPDATAEHLAQAALSWIQERQPPAAGSTPPAEPSAWPLDEAMIPRALVALWALDCAPESMTVGQIRDNAALAAFAEWYKNLKTK